MNRSEDKEKHFHAGNLIEAFRLVLNVLLYRKLTVSLLLAVMFIATVFQGVGYGALLPLLQIVTGDLSSIRNGQGVWRLFRGWLELFPEDRWITVASITFAGLAVISGGAKILAQYFSVSFSMRLRGIWMRTLMQRFLDGVYDRSVQQREGGYLNTIMNEPLWAAKLVQSFLEAVLQLLSAIALVFLLFWTNWLASIISVVVGGGAFIALHRFCMSRVFLAGRERLKLSEELTRDASENLAGLRVIKAFSIQRQRLESFGKKTKKLMRTMIIFSVLRHSYRPLLETLAIVSLAGAVAIVSEITGDRSGTFFSKLGFFAVVVMRLLLQCSELLGSLSEVVNYYPSLKLIDNQLSQTMLQEQLDSGKPFDELAGDIVFENVSFSYDPQKPLFENLNLVIRHKTTVALVGPSGGGKTTIAELRLGFYRPSGGRIIVGKDTDLSAIRLRDWRKRIGFVSQDCFLFNTTAGENLRIAKEDATGAEVKNAVIMANASDFIGESLDSMDVIVGDRGERLSAGQRQRLTIARALLRDPDILIFDEATSALDTVSEHLIHEAIERLKGKKTILLIAHRIASVRMADYIYVLHNGRVAEEGTYDELLEKKTMFWALVNAGEL